MSCPSLAGAPASGARSRPARLLFAGASAAALSSLVPAGSALADVNVGSGSTPIATATAAASGPDNVVVSSGATLSGTPAAVTLNSSNSVTNNGSITIQDASNTNGILAIGGNTGAITNNGSITLNESQATTTTDSAGNLIGPFASGSNRYGIRVVGPGALDGAIVNAGSITIQGNSSAAISVETGLTGAITSSGAITVSGQNAYGLATTGTVGGPITVTGAINAGGPAATAISVGGDAGGLSIQSAIVATGYHASTRTTTSDAALADQNANDAAIGGPAVSVAGSLTHGLLVSAPPATLSSSVTDVNGDGIADASEIAATVTSYGSAPAIQVGAVGRDIALGDVGTGASAYGVTLFGNVSGQGLRDGVSSTGLQVGVAGGGAVSTGHGVTNMGVLSANSYTADATAMRVLGGASIPTFYNAGTVNAVTTTSGAGTATAIVLESGASMPTLLNAGIISASPIGQTGQAAAIVDNSGSINHIENTGSITAAIYAGAGGAVVSGAPTVALDLRANTTGVALVSYRGTGSTTDPVISGAVKLGSGNDAVQVLAGTLAGDVSFGAGANALVIDGGATVTGAVTADGGSLALSVGSGALQINSAAPIAMPSLSLASGSTLILTADPANNAFTQLNVSGAATIASGAKIGVRLASFLTGDVTYAVIRSPQLSAGTIDTSLLGSTPYLYSASLTANPAAGEIDLNLAQKTAAQLGLSSATAGGLGAVIAGVQQDPNLTNAFLGQTTHDGFMQAYNSLLPNHNGVIFRMLTVGTDAFGRTLDDRQDAGAGGAWVQEVNFGLSQQSHEDVRGYDAWGVGLMGGYELPATRIGVFGVNLGGFTSQSRDNGSDNGQDLIANVLQAGGYWRGSWGGFTANASIDADYLAATNHREVSFVSNATTLYDSVATGHWKGMGVSSRLHLSYESRLTQAIYLRPQLGLDYNRLHEDGYTEGGGGVIDLAVGARDSSELAGFAGVAAGAQFGSADASWGPELLVGYRRAFQENLGDTTAQFLTGGSAFTVGADQASGSGPVVRVALKSESSWGAVAIQAGAEELDHLAAYDLRLAAHFAF